MGTSGLIIQAQSREEIYADKLIAFALRPNRIKYRDLWDIVWLHQQGLKPALSLIPKKLEDRHIKAKEFLTVFNDRKNLLIKNDVMRNEFSKEMGRFLPADQMNQILAENSFWEFISFLIEDSELSLHSNLHFL